MPTPPAPDDAARLGALPPSRSTPLLSAMARAQAARRRPADLRRQMARRLFCVVDADPRRADDGFEVDAVARHVAIFDRLFGGCAAVGAAFPDRAARVPSTEDVLGERVATALRAALPHAEVQRGPLDAAYYGGLRVMHRPLRLGGPAHVGRPPALRRQWAGPAADPFPLRARDGVSQGATTGRVNATRCPPQSSARAHPSVTASASSASASPGARSAGTSTVKVSICRSHAKMA